MVTLILEVSEFFKTAYQLSGNFGVEFRFTRSLQSSKIHPEGGKKCKSLY
jgi:hypothetical protein